MTIEELTIERDKILKRAAVTRVQSGERSVEYADWTRALSLIDAEIARLNAGAAGQMRTSYVSFTRE